MIHLSHLIFKYQFHWNMRWEFGGRRGMGKSQEGRYQRNSFSFFIPFSFPSPSTWSPPSFPLIHTPFPSLFSIHHLPQPLPPLPTPTSSIHTPGIKTLPEDYARFTLLYAPAKNAKMNGLCRSCLRASQAGAEKELAPRRALGLPALNYMYYIPTYLFILWIQINHVYGIHYKLIWPFFGLYWHGKEIVNLSIGRGFPFNCSILILFVFN